MWRYSTRFFPNKYDFLMFLCLFNKPHIYFFIISSNLPLLVLWLCGSYLTLLSPVAVVKCGLRSTTSCLIYSLSFFFFILHIFSPHCAVNFLFIDAGLFLGIKELFLSHIDFMFISFNFNVFIDYCMFYGFSFISSLHDLEFRQSFQLFF